MIDIRICDCGGLTYKCALYGHLPESIGHYHIGSGPVPLTVVWSGTLHRQDAVKVQLLPDREERVDSRLSSMPTYDLDDGETVDERPRRKYNLTGRHVGKFSRTNPNAPHFKPTIPRTSSLGADATSAEPMENLNG